MGRASAAVAVIAHVANDATKIRDQTCRMESVPAECCELKTDRFWAPGKFDRVRAVFAVDRVAVCGVSVAGAAPLEQGFP
ncbi:MAG: hypothetical protein B7Z73_02280 [Planctomycetia bacterium 21-64-5]|nr:MAG: hypothetical protein B7Z73_02280 [Planctomycetia bacterium 21-64-5]